MISLTIFIHLHELCGHKCPKERRIIPSSQDTKNASEICFVVMAVSFDCVVTVDEWRGEIGRFYTDKDCARQHAAARITVVCDALTSRLVLEDRAHPEVRKPTIFSVVQVKLKDPEIHDSVSWEPPGGHPHTSVAFAATFENLWRMGKMTKGWKRGKNLLSTLVLKREKRDRWQTVSQLARNFCRSTEQIP